MEMTTTTTTTTTTTARLESVFIPIFLGVVVPLLVVVAVAKILAIFRDQITSKCKKTTPTSEDESLEVSDDSDSDFDESVLQGDGGGVVVTITSQ
jgi:hypothetical protein